MQQHYQLLNQRYAIIRRVGQGGMGAVFEATDARLGNLVAVKQQLAASPQSTTAFEHEARLLARLHHPALPVVSDFFTDVQAHFLVMQYVPGDDIAMLMAQRGTAFAFADVMRWADTLLDVLEYLHTQHPSVIHRDIKPANLKLNQRGGIMLLDFGIAKGGIQTAHIGKSVRAYTLHYAPLEQIQQQPTTPRSDIYALGATLYHLLTFNVPPSALDRAAAQSMHLADPLRPASDLNVMVSPAVAAILTRAMALDPDQRYQSAREMRTALTQALSQPASYQPAGAPVAGPAATTMGTGGNTGPTVFLGAPAVPPVIAGGNGSRVTRLPFANTLRLLWQRLPSTLLSPAMLWVHWSIANLLWVWAFIPFVFIGPIAILIMGLFPAVAQSLVLRRSIWRGVTRRWLVVTSIAFPIALVVGILSTADFREPTASVPLWRGVISGLVSGALFGSAQWYNVRSAGRFTPLWILAHAISWATVVGLSIYSMGFALLAGLIHGVITGSILYYLSRQHAHAHASQQP